MIFVYCHISISRSGKPGGQDDGRLGDGHCRVGGGNGGEGKLRLNCDPYEQGISGPIFRR